MIWIRDAFLDHLVPSVSRSLVVTRVLFHLRSTFSGGLFSANRQVPGNLRRDCDQRGCGRIEYLHGPDPGIWMWPNWGTQHRGSLNDSVTLRLRDRWINAMRSLSIVEPCAEGMPGRGFPRYTLCAGSIGAADTKALDAVLRLISAASLVNAAAISS